MRLIMEEYGSTFIAMVVVFSLLAIFATGFWKGIGREATQEMEYAFSGGEDNWGDYWHEEEVTILLAKEVQRPGTSVFLSELFDIQIDGELPKKMECTYLKYNDEFQRLADFSDEQVVFENEGVYEIGIRVMSMKHREYESYFLIPVGEGGST